MVMSGERIENLCKIKVTDVGEFIRYDSCERRFFLVVHDREIRDTVPFFNRRLNNLDFILQKRGARFEDDWERTLIDYGYIDITKNLKKDAADRKTDWKSFFEQLSYFTPGQFAYGREIHVEVSLGVFYLKGDIDFILLKWNEHEPIIILVECKASRSDQTYHRIQVSLYRLMIVQLLKENLIKINNIQITQNKVKCIIARIDENTNTIQGIEDLEPIENLDQEEQDLLRILSKGGKLEQISKSDIKRLNYKLEKKCDGCIYSIYCLPESALSRSIELVSVSSSTIRILKKFNINTIDDLADLDPNSTVAQQIRADPGFNDNLIYLTNKAKARRRNLPGGEEFPDTYLVQSYQNRIQSQLPEYIQDGSPMIRVYLTVEYDYAENRLLALVSHLTISDWSLHTPIEYGEDHQVHFIPKIIEIKKTEDFDENGKNIFQERELDGSCTKTIVKTIRREWTGNIAHDNGVEESLVHDFFYELVQNLKSLVPSKPKTASLHFYVWSPIEIKRLIDACTRLNSNLLRHLNELLGCREGLEQLIYSSLQQEVDLNYALGWTGRGLSVVSSLSWYGRRYHWNREVDREVVALDRIFTQDIFDFKTTLNYYPETLKWASNGEQGSKYRFEIRSRFEDGLTLPYWHSYWNSSMFPNPEDPSLDSSVKEQIMRYWGAGQRTGLIEEYLKSRACALRWIEENIQSKNSDLNKPRINLDDLKNFNLGVTNAVESAIDFLQLDNHVKYTTWITENLIPPLDRIHSGKTLPICNVVSTSQNRLEAVINVDGFGTDISSLQCYSSYGEGSFVRISPCFDNPQSGQTIRQLLYGGCTCTIDSIDWDRGMVNLSVIPYFKDNRYLLVSRSCEEGKRIFDYATVDENISDFVSGRVEATLNSPRSNFIGTWFDPKNPNIPEKDPIDQEDFHKFCNWIDLFRFQKRGRLEDDQKLAILDGLYSRIQLIQGPPGTGKSATTSIAVLLRIIANCDLGDIVIVSANTHLAVDNLLDRIVKNKDPFFRVLINIGEKFPSINIAKVYSSHQEQEVPQSGIRIISADSCIKNVQALSRDSVLIIGGTTNSILKMASNLDRGARFSARGGFSSPMLIIDEASMMVLPHFLALSKLLAEDGVILLVGDHRQLAPIMAHDWEEEDRPPVVYYQPHMSAFQSIINMSESENSPASASLIVSKLSKTFRLPPQIVELISRIYKKDGIDLEAIKEPEDMVISDDLGSLESVWNGNNGIFLVLHSEKESRRYNPIEIKIIEEIIIAAESLEQNSIAIITPYRSQKSLLADLIGDNEAIHIIDTVERIQGGEKPIVIVSATASDPSAISGNVEFILNLNRTNVAFSRSEERLIVVCSEELINFIPSDLGYYQSSILWKSLRDLCNVQVGETTIDGTVVRIFTYNPQ